MSSISKTNAQKRHAVCVPYPAQGHINPMLQLAKLLHSKGIHITFVNTEYNHKRLVRTHGPEFLVDRPSFRFMTIPDGLSSTDADCTQDILSLTASIEQHCYEPFKELIVGLNKAQDGPFVSCVVSDMAMYFSVDVGLEFGLPVVLLWTASACGVLCYAQCQKLVEEGLFPFKDSDFITNGELKKVINCVPATKNFRLQDMPSIIRTTDPNDFYLSYTQRYMNKSKKASAIVFNTFDALEHDVLKVLSSNLPPLYPIGRMQLLLNSINNNNQEDISMISTSLWKEDPKCMEWLDSKASKSVVYVNFGSITIMTNDQLLEFAWGLANSKQPFLWITRPDLVTGSSAVLPPEFSTETKNRGFITSWCNQEKVLGNPAIGGFLTHSGWNSTLESLINGVPVICWPFFAEQYTNCWYCCNEWGFGMEIDANVKRSKVERQVRELMEGEKGKEMKRNVMEWRRLAHEVTTGPDGSSYNNFDKVLKVIGSC